MVATSNTNGEQVGAYEELAYFLKECLESKHITDSKYKSLLDDIEQVAGSGRALDTTDWKDGSETEHHGHAFLKISGIEVVNRANTTLDLDSTLHPNKDQAGEDEILEKIPPLFDIRNNTADLQEMLRDPKHNCYRVEGEIIYRAMLYGYTSPWDLEERYKLDLRRLQCWIKDISERYLDNPYHNWNHAWDVYQFCHVTLDQGGSEYFNYQDILALLVSTIAHDVAHPGQNNPFLINAGDPLAIRYNDFSPLEMMHASTAFSAMAKPQQNFLGHFKDAEYQNLRQKIIDAILATDNKHHFELVDRFKTRVSKVESQAAPFAQNTKEDREKQKSSKEDRRLLLQAWMHMSDISGVTRPFENHSHQAQGLEAEFFAQGDLERKKGKPVSFLCDREKDSLAAGQGFWISGMVSPLFQPFSTFIEEQLTELFTENMDSNKKAWEVLLEKYGRKTAGEILALAGQDNSLFEFTPRPR